MEPVFGFAITPLVFYSQWVHMGSINLVKTSSSGWKREEGKWQEKGEILFHAVILCILKGKLCQEPVLGSSSGGQPGILMGGLIFGPRVWG